MGGEVVVEEELAGHGEEGEVVVDPGKHEEPARVVEAVSCRCEPGRRSQLEAGWREGGGSARTIGDGGEAASFRELVGTDDADKDGERHDAEPPADRVPDHVDLLAVLVRARPEADPAEEEGPVDRSGRIRVRVRETRVVLEHRDLELEELAEKVHRRDRLGLDGRRSPGFGRVYERDRVSIAPSRGKKREGRNLLSSRTISSTTQNVVLSFRFLFPLTSCCLNAHSGRGGSTWVHMATLSGT